MAVVYSTVRAVVSLEEAEGHQHLAGEHGGGCEQMSPLPPRGPSDFFCIFLIQNPAFWCILWLRKWVLPSLVSSTQLTSTSTSTSTQGPSTSTSTSTSGPSTSTSTSTKHKSLALRHTAQNKRCCSLVYGQTSNIKYSLIN